MFQTKEIPEKANFKKIRTALIILIFTLSGLYAREKHCAFKNLKKIDNIHFLKTNDLDSLSIDNHKGSRKLNSKSIDVNNITRLLNRHFSAYNTTVKITRKQVDRLGNTHIRFSQYYKGIPIFGSDMVLHIDPEGKIYGIAGKFSSDNNISTKPGISAISARKKAAGKSRTLKQITDDSSLVIIDGKLAYELVVNESTDRIWQSFVDANSGEIICEISKISKFAPSNQGEYVTISGNKLESEGGASVTITGWYDQPTSSYYLFNKEMGWGIYNWPLQDWAYNSSSNWGTSNRALISLADNLSKVTDYVKNVLHLNSYDNQGSFMQANAFETFSVEGAGPDNACWDGVKIRFGAGDSKTHPLTTLEVVAHEYGHAITAYSSGLIHSGEAAGLNESYSDILGALVEAYFQPDGRSYYPNSYPGHSDWIIGEDVVIDRSPRRDMRNPNRVNHPSRYNGTFWASNADEHLLGGVQDFAFYLLSDGGIGTNDGLPYNISGIGITQAGEIAMYANIYLLTSTSNYHDSRDAWIMAAQTLGYSASVIQTIENVWDACGVTVDSHLLSVNTISLNFGLTGRDAEKHLTLTLSNSGDGSTIVNYIQSSNPDFFCVTPVPLVVPAGSSKEIMVCFKPSTIGSASANLTINSNAQNTPTLNANLVGTGINPAVMRYSQSEINMMADLNEKLNVNFMVANYGSADLTYDFTTSSEYGLKKASVMLFTMANTNNTALINQLNNLSNIASLTTYTNTSPLISSDQLLDYDVILVTTNGGYWTYPWIASSFGDTLGNYVDKGGSVILMNGSFEAGNHLSPIRGKIMEYGYSPMEPVPSEITLNNGYNTLASVISHPITSGVQSLSVKKYTVQGIPFGDGVALGRYLSGHMIGAYNPRKNIVALNVFPDATNWQGDLMILISNSIDWLTRGKWLSSTQSNTQFNLPSAGVDQIELLLDATKLTAGQYNGKLVFNHNDPAAVKPLEIPVRLRVGNYNTNLRVSPVQVADNSTITFNISDPSLLGKSASLDLYKDGIKQSSTNITLLSGINTKNQYFSSYYSLGWYQYKLVIDGFVADEFSFEKVAKTHIVTATPLTLSFGQVIAGNSKVMNITLTNTGNSNATITSIQASDPVFTVNNTLPVTIAPAATVTLPVTFSPTAAGIKNGSLTLINAPDENIQTIIINLNAEAVAPSNFDVTMTVDGVNNDNIIKPIIYVKNIGTQTVNLSDIIIEYYSYNPGLDTSLLTTDIYYCSKGTLSSSSSRLSGTYGNSTNKADMKTTLSFSSASLTTGENLQINIALHSSNWQYNFNEEDDWSHVTAAGNNAQNIVIKNKLSGQVLFGIVPTGM